MALMTWGPDLQIGFADIDRQHKRLVELVNQLSDAMQNGKGRGVVNSVLSELVRYTVSHFAFEERLMDRYQISTSAAHKAEHKKLVTDVTALQAKLDAGSLSVTVELMSFLHTWLKTHILETDKALAAELNAKGAKSAASAA
jgi:hemerythrin-like metal-binding protein